MATWRRRVAEELDPGLRAEPGLSLANRVLVAFVLSSIVVVVLETEPILFARYGRVFHLLDTLVFVVFLAEYVLRLWSCVENPSHPRRLRYALRPLLLVDLAVIVAMAIGLLGVEGAFLRLLRLIRLLRLAKLGEYSRAMEDLSAAIVNRRHELVISVMIALMLLLVCASTLYAVEGPHQPEHFGSIPRAMWWAAATLTTVGYGDVVPVTPLGRILAAFTAVSGIGLIAMPAGILAAAMSEVIQKRRDDAR